MQDEGTPKMLQERTGRSRCTRCLSAVELDEFLRNDHLCDRCAADGNYPLKSTPDAPGDSKDSKR
jgi:uncharacterized protein (DUF983 family)